MADDYADALKYALRMLGYRDRSASDMRQKLAGKGFAENIIDSTIERLEEKGFLDDRKFAEQLSRDAIERRNYGYHGVRRYLLKKGIPPDIIGDVADRGGDYEGSARRLVEKKMKLMENCSRDTARRRLWGVLSRRGFTPGEIQRVLKDYFEN